MAMEDNIRSFIAFMNEHQNEEMLYIGLGGILQTKGCSTDPTFGGCCSKQFDLLGLVADLEELLSDEKEKEA